MFEKVYSLVLKNTQCFSVEIITTRAKTPATLSYCMVPSWITPATFDTTMDLFFCLLAGCNWKLKTPAADPRSERKRRENGDDLKTFVGSGSQRNSSRTNHIIEL
ncbi:hypothetical protein TNCV_4858761 [Trichonephila clavipes]|nr:hypothetical protein TNCV_4858761 [Trichonephila clavipes]